MGACQTPTVTVPPWATVPLGALVGVFAAGDGVHAESSSASAAASGNARRHPVWLEGVGREPASDTSVHCAPPV